MSRLASSGARAETHVIHTGRRAKHVVYVDVTGIVGYANVVAVQCDCGAENHPSVVPGEYVHSESCPLYE